MNIRVGRLQKIQFSTEFEALLNPAERTRRLIWASVAGAILLVIGLAAAWLPGSIDQDNSGAGRNDFGLAPFHMVAMALAVVSLLVRSYGFSDRRLREIIARPPAGTVGPQGQPVVPHSLSDPELRLWRLFDNIMPIHLIGWSVNGLIILLGFAAVWFAGRFDAIYPFAFMSVVLHVLMYPRFEPFARRATTLGLVSGPGLNG